MRTHPRWWQWRKRRQQREEREEREARLLNALMMAVDINLTLCGIEHPAPPLIPVPVQRRTHEVEGSGHEAH